MKEKFLNAQLNFFKNYHYVLLAPSVLYYIVRSIRYIRSPFESPDAEKVYLPFAKKFLEIGPSLFFEKASLITSPGTYLWPALFNANPLAIRIAGMILGLFILFLIYQIGKELYSKIAGLIASFLFAISPTLIVWIPSLLSEPTYIFFSVFFIWSLIKIAKGKQWGVPAASLSLMISIFIRPILLYPAIFFLVIFFFMAIVLKKQRKLFTCFSISLLLGLTFPFVFIIRNQIKYNLPSIAVGSGAVLFYGTNPFTGGFEPPVMNLTYGIGAQNRPELDEPQNLIVRNQKLMAVSKAHLANMTIKEFITFIAKKISWFMFFTPLESSYKAAFLRAFEISLGLYAFIWGFNKRNYPIIFLAAIVAVQIGQAILALYNIRYSSGILEPLLLVLGAIGATLLIEVFQENLMKFYKDLILCSIFLTIGIFLHYNVLPKTYYPSSIPFYILFEKKIDTFVNEGSLVVDVSKLSPKVTANTFVKIDFLPQLNFHNCRNNFIYFKGDLSQGKFTMQAISFEDINEKSELFIGALTSSMEKIFKENGKLVVETDCQVNKKFPISKISIIEANVDKFWN
jgi:4-amino-4-deoxy-L-arabinose transferase-like glycosyltransferase